MPRPTLAKSHPTLAMPRPTLVIARRAVVAEQGVGGGTIAVTSDGGIVATGALVGTVTFGEGTPAATTLTSSSADVLVATYRP